MMSERRLNILSISAIGLLVVVVLVRWLVALSHDAKLRGNQAMMRSHVYALVNYSESNGGLFPDLTEWPDVLFDQGWIEPSLFEYADVDKDQVVYQYLPYQNGIVDRWILLYEDRDHWSEGVVVGFADRRVEIIEHTEFERMLAKQLASKPQSPDPETP